MIRTPSAGVATGPMTVPASGDSIMGLGSVVFCPSQHQIDEAVARFVGVPYRHNGRDMDGLDCLGLVVLFYRHFGIEIPDGDGEPIQKNWWVWDPERYIRGILRQGRPAGEPLRALDLVYFAMKPGIVSHAGVMIDTERFIHVLEDHPVMVSRLGSWWRRRFAGARRLI